MVVTATKAGAPHASWVGVANPVIAGKQYQWTGAAWGAVDLTKIAPAAVTDARYVVGAQPSDNLFVGNVAGSKNTTGDGNNFLGNQSGMANTTGNYNNFLGRESGKANTTGFANNFLGYQSGTANTTGVANNFLGFQSGMANTTGVANNFLGQQSGMANTTGGHNNFLGYKSGMANTTGDGNNFLGNQSGMANTTGHDNNFLGYLSGMANTTGHNNNFLGYQSGAANATGQGNTTIGGRSGAKSTPVIGAQGLTGAKTWNGPWVAGDVYFLGAQGTATIDGVANNHDYFVPTTTTHVFGAQAGQTANLGKPYATPNLQNTSSIGYYATAAFDNSTAIGANSLTDKANQVVLGDGTVVEVKTNGIYVGKIGGVSQRMVGLQELKTLVAAAADFNAFKTAIAALT
jgi:hypothetical protein